jgi:hypothetical protein
VTLRAQAWLPAAARLAWQGELSCTAKVVLLVGWALITAVVAAHHEPWRDEADAWLFARDFDPLTGDLRRATACVGMPALWFAVLMPLPKGGLPYWSMTAASWLITALAVWLLVWRSPLPAVLRALLPFSYLLGYEYPVVARSYGLSVLLLFLCAHLHPTRRDRPLATGLLIGLLANTSAHGFFIAFGLGVGLVLELRPLDRRGLAAVALALALGSAALWQLYPHPDGQLLSGSNLWNLSIAVGGALLPVVPGTPSLLEPGAASLRLSTALAVVIAVSALVAVAPRRPVLLAGLLALAGLLFIFAFKYYGSARHHGLLQLVVVWCCWVARGGGAGAPAPLAAPLKLATAGLTLALVLVLPMTVATWRLEVRRPFSGSREAATLLVERGLDDGVIAAHPLAQGTAVLPYLRTKTLWWPAIGAARSHNTWDLEYQQAHPTTPLAAAELARRQLPAGSCLLLIEPLAEPAASGFELVFETSRPFRYDEQYWLYRLVEPRR